MTQSLFDKMTQSILTSADRKLTMADLMLEMASHLDENDPERIFTEWLVDNRGRHREACQELGVEYPPEGEDLVRRLKEVVMPVLMKHSTRTD